MNSPDTGLVDELFDVIDTCAMSFDCFGLGSVFRQAGRMAVADFLLAAIPSASGAADELEYYGGDL